MKKENRYPTLPREEKLLTDLDTLLEAYVNSYVINWAAPNYALVIAGHLAKCKCEIENALDGGMDA